MRSGVGYKRVAGRTVQVLFKHGEYSLGLQLVVGKLTGFGVLQSYLSATTQPPRSSYACSVLEPRVSEVFGVNVCSKR